MADIQGLYVVTGVVLVALFGWVAAVLARAPTAVDETPHSRAAPTVRIPNRGSTPKLPGTAPPPELELLPDVERAEPPFPPEPEPAPPEPTAEPTPDPAPPEPAPTIEPKPTPLPEGPPARAEAPTLVVEGSPEAEPEPPPKVVPPPPAPEAARPVVVLPPIRHRLDSHPEITDSSPSSNLIVIGGPDAPARQASRLALATAFGRSAPRTGKPAEPHVILEAEHLFVFTDGGGRRAGADLVGAIALNALTQAFDKDDKAAFPDDPKLGPRANRLRRAVLEANRVLLKRARALAFAGLGASGFVAQFSPTNEQMNLAHVGLNRAYRLRGGQLSRLTSPQATRQLGLIERVEVEVLTDSTEEGDRYLFCSEALARVVGDAELAVTLGLDASLEEVTRRLIAAVEGHAESRDALAMVVRVEKAPDAHKRAKTQMGLG